MMGDPLTANPAIRPGQDAAERLVWSRQLLLDLTIRNRLLNFPAGAPGFKDRDNRVYKYLPVSARLGDVWKRLIDEEKGIRVFARLDDPESADPPVRDLIEGTLFANVDEEHLTKRLQKLYRERATLESSTGDSAFFLALGFLEWFEAPPKEPKTLFAPLLLLHVRVVKRNAPGGGPRSFVLEMDADEHQGNPCLREKLKAEHDIVLPPADVVGSPEEYFRKVEASIRSKPRWRVHRTAALGFFNFARYRLWLDLDKSQWPQGAAPADHPIVRDLVDQRWRGDERPLPDEAEIAEHQQERDLPIVLDADGTQYAALLAALRGQSLVVIGPPGSGKSQTITNLIAAAIAEGRRVLFVAQKLAALEVVQRRLGEVGLSAFSLPLHSGHCKPLDVHRQLRSAGALRAEGSTWIDGSPVGGLARTLNHVAGRLASRSLGLLDSAAEIMQRGCVMQARARQAWAGDWNDRLLELDVPEGPLPAGWIDDRERCLREWARLSAEAGPGWEGWLPEKLFPMDLGKVESALRSVRAAAESVQARLGLFPATLAAGPVPRIATALKEVQRLGLPPEVNAQLLRYAWAASGQSSQKLHQLERLLEDYRRQRGRAFAVLREVDGDPQVQARTITAAAAVIAERLDPDTPLSSVEGSLHELAATIGLVDDVLASVAIFPEGVEFLHPASATKTMTWGIVEALAKLRLLDTVRVRPQLHSILARGLAEGRVLPAEAAQLVARLERARTVADRAERLVPGIVARGPEDRGRATESAAALDAYMFGELPFRQCGNLRAAATTLLSRTDLLLHLRAASDDAFNRLLPTGATPACCRELAVRSATWTSEILRPPAGVAADLLFRLGDALAREHASPAMLRAWAAAIESTRSLEAQARAVLSGLPAEAEAEAADAILPLNLGTALRAFCNAGGSSARVSAVLNLQKLAAETTRTLDEAVRFATPISRALGQPVPTTLANLRRLAALAMLVRRMPGLPSGGILDRVASAADVVRLRQAMAECTDAISRRQSLAIRFALADLPPRQEIAVLRRHLRSHQGRLFRWLSGDYRSARRAVRGFANAPLPADRQLVEDLDAAEAFLDTTERMAADGQLSQLIGAAFKGIATDWTGVASVLAWAEEFYGALGGGASVPLAHAAAVSAKGGPRLGHAQILTERLTSLNSQLCATYPWGFAGSPTALAADECLDERSRLADLRQAIDGIAAAVGGLAQELASLGSVPESTLGDADEALSRFAAAAAAHQGLAPLRQLTQVPLTRIEPAQLRAIADWYEAARGHGVSHDVLASTLVEGNDAVQAIMQIARAAAEWTRSADRLAELAQGGRWTVAGALDEQRAAAAELLRHLDVLDGGVPAGGSLELTVAALRDLLAELRDFDEARRLSLSWNDRLGEPAFDADLSLMRDTTVWMRSAMDAGASGGLLGWCLAAETTPRLTWWQTLVASCRALRGTIERLLAARVVQREEFEPGYSLAEWREAASGRRATLGSSTEILFGAACDAGRSVQDLVTAAAALARACGLADELKQWEQELAASVTELQPRQVADHRRWVAAARSLPTGLAEWIVEGDPSQRQSLVTAACHDLAALAAGRDKLASKMRGLGEVLGVGPAEIFDGQSTLSELIARTGRLEGTIPRLLPWASCVRERAAVVKLGLGHLVDAAAKSSASVPTSERLTLTLRAAVAVQQANAAWQSDPRLVSLRGSEHDRLRREFALADQSLLQRNRARVVHEVLGQARGAERPGLRQTTREMYALLKHEEQKQKRHLPVRRLVERAGPALQEFCPCWLMTPLAGRPVPAARQDRV